MDDSRVNQVSLNEVLNQKAYVLFYTRLPTVSLQESNTENKVSTSMVCLSVLLNMYIFIFTNFYCLEFKQPATKVLFIETGKFSTGYKSE